MSSFIDFFKAVAGVCRTKPLSPRAWVREGERIRIDLAQAPELQREEGAAYLKGRGLKRPILLVRVPGKGLLAFRNRCTHIGGRKLDPVPGQPLLRCCSISHSRFDLEGTPVGGPAKRPLTRYRVEETDGEAVVYLE